MKRSDLSVRIVLCQDLHLESGDVHVLKIEKLVVYENLKILTFALYYKLCTWKAEHFLCLVPTVYQNVI